MHPRREAHARERGRVDVHEARHPRLRRGAGGDEVRGGPWLPGRRPGADRAHLRLPGLRRATLQPAALDPAADDPRPPGARGPDRAARPHRARRVGGPDRRERGGPRARERAPLRGGRAEIPRLAPAAGGGVARRAPGRGGGPGAGCAPPPPGAPVGPRRPRPRGGRVALGPRRAVHPLPRRPADAVPGALADAARREPARDHVHGPRRDRRPGGLRLRGGALPRLQALGRRRSGGLEARAPRRGRRVARGSGRGKRLLDGVAVAL